MTRVRDIMTTNPTYAETSETVMRAARTMAAEGVGALPIQGEDHKLKGMLTDRDVVVKVLAEGKDPMAVHVGELAQGEVVAVRPEDDAAEALRLMSRHQVRRLPVVEGEELVGIVAQADAARDLPDADVGGLVKGISHD
ncbi:CBS domain-containing protein [Saccharomonospora azurea]|uniref:Signal-transduction protein containing cAMP-binding and CBS domains n=1 Tax=Saccharomonospora azurea NA-128 TaxID=882081 RepID=H8GCR3_9PSEU|nr:CBS domain-containing protein [Saccharomonospora azurea]EHY90836.1 putative signal-transduction protein containing cAMP-binding and CBS domains [Saccharomonospora azurea NA-128]